MSAVAIEFAAGSAARSAVAQGAPRVLWIDDDDGAIEPGLDMLRRHGFDVERAGTAAAAESMLDAADADLVILETALPDADSLALCRRISEAETTPVLVVARAADTLDRVAGLEFGADDVLAKTTHPLELLARVRALLRRATRHARVARLRRTLSACDGAGDFIKTLRGGGYLFQAQVTARGGLAAA